jgi:Flp pilus assembly protein TadG
MMARRSLPKALAGRGRACLWRSEGGMAAVEFALILPMMLMLYFGCVLLAQGLEAGRKTQMLSRTLTDLTAQTLVKSSTDPSCTSYANYTTVPCLADSDILNILAASPAVLYPFAGTTNMTISEIVFDNVSAANTQCCVAKVLWSVGSGPSPTLRQCPTLNQSANGVNGATVIPAGAYPPTVANGNVIDTYLIVADVTYTYAASFGFQNNNWSSGSTYVIARTTYMSPRNGANTGIRWAPGGSISSSNYVVCTPNRES